MATDSATGSSSSTAPTHGSSENFFNLLRILIVSDDMLFLEAVSSELMACGYYVQMISSGGLAIELLHKPNANFHIVLLDASLKSQPPWILLDQTQRYFKNICVIVMTADYTPAFAKRSIDQGASLVIEKERIGSIYYILWQLVIGKEKLNLEMRSLRDRRRMVYWDGNTRTDFEHTYRLASADRILGKIAELMSVLRMYTQSVASYMRRTSMQAGAGPLLGQLSSIFEQIAAQEASASHVAAPRDPLADAGEQMLSDLQYLLNDFYWPDDEFNFPEQ
ncbi:uncharacterized protein LOC109715628 [Ananas comosus]|uniref:Uncharacterized protein LOC109715628 n=1 Tax=Ananas comosus TaxID=4615 RepID=A0A6P5FK46_ANACO|nr:uncharacterized protein LOC109715628 [Ananas comosus]